MNLFIKITTLLIFLCSLLIDAYADSAKQDVLYKRKMELISNYNQIVKDSLLDSLEVVKPLLDKFSELNMENDSIILILNNNIKEITNSKIAIEKSSLNFKKEVEKYKYIVLGIIGILLISVILIIILSASKSKKLKKFNSELQKINDLKKEENLRLKFDVELIIKERKALENEISALSQNIKLLEEKNNSELNFIKSEKNILSQEVENLKQKLEQLNSENVELNEKNNLSVTARNRVEKELEGFVKELRGILPLPE